MRIGLNLLIFGKRRGEDMPGVLAEVAQAGYEAVELGPPAEPEPVLEALRKHGITVACGHTNLNTLEGTLDQNLDWLARTGGRLLACSGPDFPTGAQYAAAAERLDRAGARCRARGVTLCYHNHAHEIVHDMFGLTHILRGSDPANVRLCLDTYWVARGGQDPATVIRALGARIGYMHLKDMSPDGDFAEVGQGKLDWAGIREAVTAAGVDVAMVEQDRTQRTPLESVTLSRQYLRQHWA